MRLPSPFRDRGTFLLGVKDAPKKQKVYNGNSLLGSRGVASPRVRPPSPPGLSEFPFRAFGRAHEGSPPRKGWPVPHPGVISPIVGKGRLYVFRWRQAISNVVSQSSFLKECARMSRDGLRGETFSRQLRSLVPHTAGAQKYLMRRRRPQILAKRCVTSKDSAS